jgi:hypothetical protein
MLSRFLTVDKHLTTQLKGDTSAAEILATSALGWQLITSGAGESKGRWCPPRELLGQRSRLPSPSMLSAASIPSKPGLKYS